MWWSNKKKKDVTEISMGKLMKLILLLEVFADGKKITAMIPELIEKASSVNEQVEVFKKISLMLVNQALDIGMLIPINLLLQYDKELVDMLYLMVGDNHKIYDYSPVDEIPEDVKKHFININRDLEKQTGSI